MWCMLKGMRTLFLGIDSRAYLRTSGGGKGGELYSSDDFTVPYRFYFIYVHKFVIYIQRAAL